MSFEIQGQEIVELRARRLDSRVPAATAQPSHDHRAVCGTR